MKDWIAVRESWGAAQILILQPQERDALELKDTSVVLVVGTLMFKLVIDSWKVIKSKREGQEVQSHDNVIGI